MRVRACLAAIALAAGSLLAGAVAATPAYADGCTVKPGGQLGDTWPQRRLDFQQVWPITRGAGVRVAVIDSGIAANNPQMLHAKILPGVDVIGGGFRPDDVRDCYGHGSAVASIIAAQPTSGSAFVGVAPDATLLPIKQTNTQDDKTGTADGIARGILAALARHAQVANISVAATEATPALTAAVAEAAARNMVIVAAAGNDGQGANLPAYPAAFSTRFSNVIAVSATDVKDAVAPFSDSGRYVTVAAPGVSVPTAAPYRGYLTLSGTSFATPYVTGTVALMVSAHPGLTPAQVRNRLIATADAPPATVPDASYGYGIVNPYLAVTEVRDDDAAPPTTHAAAPLPPPAAPHPASRHLQHVALAAAVALIAAALLVAVGAAVLRGSRVPPGEPGPHRAG